MKFIKKAVAAVLGLTMSFSLFACGDNTGDTSGDITDSSISGGNVTDSSISGGDVTDSSAGGSTGGNQEGDGAKYLAGIVEAMKEANTITLDLTASTKQEITGRTNGVSPTDGNKETVSTSSMTVDITLNCVFAKTENGYDASIKGNLTGTKDEYKYEEPVEMRIVDGVVYNYDFDDEIWESENFADLIGEEGSQVYTVLETIYTALNSGNVDLSKVYATLGAVLDQYCTIENGAYNYELDLKDEMNATIQYLANFDYNQTAEAFLNDVLKQLGAETTVKAIFDELASYGTYTVGNAYEDINALVQKEFGKDLNALKDELIVKAESLLAQFKDYISAEEYAQITAMIAQIKTIKLEELIAPYKDFSVNNLIGTITDNAYTSVKALLDDVYAIISTTKLTDIFKTIGMEDFVEIMNELKHATFTDYSQKFGMKFNGFKLSSASEDVKFGFVYDGTHGKAMMEMSESIEVKLNSATTTIEAPIAA